MALPDYGDLLTVSASGDFTNPQYTGSYIDCTGLTFTLTFYDEPNEYVLGSSFVNGVGTCTAWGTIIITASPSQFTTTGEQTVTFTATQDFRGSTRTCTPITKSVNVQAGGGTTKNIYVFTNDGRRAIWGTIEVVDSPYQEVEYIEGTGTQYIDSEVPGNTSNF